MTDEAGFARPRVLVIVPAWNEQDSVVATINEIRTTNPAVDVLVIDDGSVDGTAARAEQAGALVCRLPFNLGVGGAMRAGFRYALRHEYDAAVQVDADGQHDPSYLGRLVDGLATSDVVIGSRFAGPDATYQVHGPRRWAMSMLGRVLSRLARTPINDATSGFRAANRRAIGVFAAHYPAEYLGDTVESLVIALRTGCTIQQVPVVMRPRTTGTASASPGRATIYLFRAVVALALALVRRWPTQVAANEPVGLAVDTSVTQPVGRL